LGGHFGRPRIRREKRKRFYRGVYIQLRSNSFYQKFIGKTIAPPRQLAGRGGAETQTRRLGRKKFFWGVGQKEIFCALAATRNFLNELKLPLFLFVFL